MKKIIFFSLFGILFNVAKAQLCSGSLGDPVVKIDFGSGTVGSRGSALGTAFTSYTYSSSGFPNDGYYTIANTTSGMLSDWWTTYDHDYQTTGQTTGYMMVVNASLSVTDYFFKDTVTGLCAGTTYEFAAWVLNLFNNGNTVYPNLTFNIYDASTGTNLGTYNTGNIVGSTSKIDWQQYGFYFTATTNSVVLKITNNKAGAAPGNDLALDDITFRPCGSTITATYSSDGSVTKETCMGTANTLQLSSSYSAATSNTQYQWEMSTDSGTTWKDISGATSSTYDISVTKAGTYWYRIATAEGTNINSSTCRILSDTIKLIVETYSAATLLNSYINCNNYTFNFKNEDTSSSSGVSYVWKFGDGVTSTATAPTYTYADTGTYVLALNVTNSLGCVDSAKSTVKVYPGFTPAFSVTGSCYLSPFQFTDKSSAAYGSINGWNWNFGDAAATVDTSILQNPSHTFSSTGSFPVALTVTSTKGCSGSVTDTVVAYGKPSVYLPFTDTLICGGDQLPLIVQTSAPSVTWTPATYLDASTIHNDTAWMHPPNLTNDTTIYQVILKENGCIDTATIQVNVLPFITVQFSADTAICKTDTITLRPVSYALSYLWNQIPTSGYMSNYTAKNPLVAPDTTTSYYVTANLGHCQDSAHMTVFVSPYPVVTVNADTSICYEGSAQLSGTTNAPYYAWSPTSTLTNSNTLTPIASPLDTTKYYLTVHDTLYCPKYVSDSVTVNVIPKLIINPGNDTSVIINEPLQFNVTGGSTSDDYSWTPTTELSNPAIYNPVATYTKSDPDSILYTVTVTTKEGCTGSGDILVKVYKIGPDILVPTGFTPNGDGLNDVLKPILLGITDFHYFNIYNRYGQLIYSTHQSGTGWDGTLNGIKQSSGTFIYMTEGIDFLGKTIFRKGTTILIR